MAKVTIPGDFVLEEPAGNANAAKKNAGATDGYKLINLPLDQVHIIPGLNPRFWGSPKSKAHIKSIEKSILARAESGLPGFMPEKAIVVFVRKIDGKDVYVLRDGQHRLAGANGANLVKPGVVETIPAFVDPVPMTDAQLALSFATVNDGEKLSPYELAVTVKRAADAGASKKEIMAELNITDRYMLDLGLLYNADPRVIELVAQDKISGTLVIEEIKEHGQEKATKRILKGFETATAAGKTKATKKHLTAAPAKPPKVERTPKKGATEQADTPPEPQPFFDATLNTLEVMYAFNEQFGESDSRLKDMMMEVIRVNGADDLVNYAVALERYEMTGLIALGIVTPEDDAAAAKEEPAHEAQKGNARKGGSRSKKGDKPSETPAEPDAALADGGAAVESHVGTAEGL